MKDHAIAYVDGSYNRKTATGGYGVVFLYEEDEPEFFSGHCEGELWNVSGEIQAALFAVEKALEYGCQSIEIHHDYQGIRSWVDGSWRTKTEETMNYQKKMSDYLDMIDISFSHVKAHTGDRWNEKADDLAKEGAGVAVVHKPDVNVTSSMQTASATIADVPEKPVTEPAKSSVVFGTPSKVGINENCRRGLTQFFRQKKHSFSDFMHLKTFGLDDFSRMKEPELTVLLGNENCRAVKAAINHEESYVAALRWAARGLCPDDAAHKVNVDMEVKQNCCR